MGQKCTHIVQPGDTYWKIYCQTDKTPTKKEMEDWASKNGFDITKSLPIGKKLSFSVDTSAPAASLENDNTTLPPKTYKIKKGDNLIKIATKFGVSRHVIMYVNNIDEEGAKSLQIGQEIIIPDKVVGKKISASEKQTNEFRAQVEVINSKLDGQLKNKGEIITETSRAYNVDPLVLTAIIMAEVGRGNKVKHKNNFIGIKSSKGKFVKYLTCKVGIEAAAKQLRDYNDVGRKTFEKIGEIHCPVNSKEANGYLNSYWVNNTTKFYNELKKMYDEKLIAKSKESKSKNIALNENIFVKDTLGIA